jgi:hypothetical protein
VSDTAEDSPGLHVLCIQVPARLVTVMFFSSTASPFFEGRKNSPERRPCSRSACIENERKRAGVLKDKTKMVLSEDEADALLIQLAQRAGGIVPLLYVRPRKTRPARAVCALALLALLCVSWERAQQLQTHSFRPLESFSRSGGLVATARRCFRS